MAAVRLALGALGVEGYGTYAAVMGVVGAFMLFRGAIEQTARRFVSHEYGKGSVGDVQGAFSAVVVLSIAMTVILIAIGETAGLWFVVRHLVVSPGGVRSAVVAYQLGLLSAAAALLSIPFAALVVAEERMAFFVVVGVLEAIFALVASWSAVMCPRFGLEAYALTLAIGALASLAVHVVFCRVRMPHVRVSVACSSGQLMESASFLGWGALSSVGNAFKYRGVCLVVNGYAGVAFSAAWDVAIAVWTYIHGFCGDFMQAFSPPMFKAWASGDGRRLSSLVAWTTIVSATIAAVPSAFVFVFAPELVGVWLGDGAPPQVVAFIRCSAVNVVFDAASNPLTTTILATGRVRLYQTVACIFSLLGFASAWALLASGRSAWTSLAAVAASNGAALIYRHLHVRFLVGVRPSFAVRPARGPEQGRTGS